MTLQSYGHLLNSESTGRVSFSENARTTTEWGFHVDEGILQRLGYLVLRRRHGEAFEPPVRWHVPHQYLRQQRLCRHAGHDHRRLVHEETYVDHVKTTSEPDGTAPLAVTKEDAN